MDLFKKNDLTEKLIIVSCYLVEKIYEYNKSKKKKIKLGNALKSFAIGFE